MPIQHLSSSSASKSYYLDRSGNMSTSSNSSSSNSTSGIITSGVIGGGIGGSGGCRKQILSLKPKQSNGYVQHLEFKEKDPLSSLSSLLPAPVTVLALKKKEKSEKNVVTMLTYRKPSSLISSSGSTSSNGSFDHHHHHLNQMNNIMNNQLHLNHHHDINNHYNNQRPGSPNSSGYDTDSLVEQENCDVFSSLLNSALAYNNGLMMHHDHHHLDHQYHHHDMLHSHPIWSSSPQLPSSGIPSTNHHGLPSNFFLDNNDNKFLVQ